MKKGWDQYATKNRFEQKGYFRKHCKRSPIRKASEASCCDCVQQSGESQKEEVVELSGNSGQLKPSDPLFQYGSVVLLTEEVVFKGSRARKKKAKKS